MFDYGDVKENVKHCWMPVPPSYNMTNIPNDVPLFLAYGGKDALSVQEDAKLLLDSLHQHEQTSLLFNIWRISLTICTPIKIPILNPLLVLDGMKYGSKVSRISFKAS
ncbi:Triacylglycerol lipase 2 [Sesamum angolense]|uniref:Triacylglycerol lipase 2 n=1 Tax=Sesamum angolense TaxID=2727404 RepID=A0AAE1WR81_9LAMI|nr:Triacylglycerol lipase 2 [Sesamum angolense]